MKRLPLLAALPLALRFPRSPAQPLMSVGYFNGGGDVTAGPGGDIDKAGRPADHPSQLPFGLIYNDEKDETNAAPEGSCSICTRSGCRRRCRRICKSSPALRKQNPDLKVLLSGRRLGRAWFLGAAATCRKSRLSLFVPRRKSSSNMVWTALTSTGSFRVNGAWGLGGQPAG